MPKKTKVASVNKLSTAAAKKRDADFFFFVTVSVFASLMVFAASYLTQMNQEIQARRSATKTLPVAQLDLATPNPPQYHNIAPKKAK